MNTNNPPNQILTLTLLGSLLSFTVQADPLATLERINQAAADVSFTGSFIYSHDDTIEVMEVVRRVDNGMLRERLYALNGDPREIVRNEKEVWCYIPDQNVGVHQARQATNNNFPQVLPANLDTLKYFYTFRDGENARIADRMTQEIRVIPRDDFRYGYSLWADQETGLLLRSDLIDENKQIVEQYLFVNIDINPAINEQQLQARTEKSKLKWFGESKPKWTESDASLTNWSVQPLPDGFRIARHIKRMTPMTGQMVEHFVITDGMSSVSIFIKKANPNQSEMQGLTRMGALHAYRNTILNFHVTVLGEVPARTVKYLANSVQHNG